MTLKIIHKQILINCIDCKKEFLQDSPNRRLCNECKIIRRKASRKLANKNRKNKVISDCVFCGLKTGFTNRKYCKDCSSKRQLIFNRRKRSVKEFNRLKVLMFKSWVMWGEKQ